jgi:hypothetical protein
MVKLIKRRWSAVVIVSVFGGLFAASAAAKTVTVGQLPAPTTDCSGPFTVMQSGVASGRSYSVPAAGVITSWSWHDGASTVSGLQLKVGRHRGGAKYTIVGRATPGTQKAKAVNTYKTHIPVKAGDLIGFSLPVGGHGFCVVKTGNPLDKFVANNGDVPLGTTALFKRDSHFKFPVSVKVALDCVVPNLKGKTLKAAKRALKKASCTLGKVTPKGQTTGTVKSQKPAAGKTLAPGASVNVRLG